MDYLETVSSGLLIFLIFWLVVWLVVYLVFNVWAIVSMAEQRGRSKLGWVLIAFFITTPVFAIPLLFFLGDTDEKREERIMEDELLKLRIREEYDSENSKIN